MSNQKKQGTFARLKKHFYRLAVAATILALGAGTCTAIVRAVSCTNVSECNSKIANLQNKSSDAQASLNNLQSKANTYQQEISQLQQQIDSLQGEINQNEAKQAAYQKKIDQLKTKIAAQKVVLGDVIRTMYVEGGMSNIEMLASSENLSTYVNKQEYRSVVQHKIQSTLEQIKSLQSDVEAKKARVDDLLSELDAQRANLSASKAKQDSLLSYNQQQQDSYSQQLADTNSQINKLQSERAAALAAITGSNGTSAVGAPIQYKDFWTANSMCGGGYSYCGAGMDQRVYGPWGSGLGHECVNFVSDWLYRHGFQGPYNPGNANQWPGYGADVSPSQVRVGDVAYMPIAPVGHVGIVTAINGDGTFHIEQMNWPIGGYYSEMDLYPQNVTFVQFPRR